MSGQLVRLSMQLSTNLTALIVEGELTRSFRRKQMEKMASKLEEHYIIQTADTLVYISTTEGKDALEKFLHGEP